MPRCGLSVYCCAKEHTASACICRQLGVLLQCCLHVHDTFSAAVPDAAGVRLSRCRAVALGANYFRIGKVQAVVWPTHGATPTGKSKDIMMLNDSRLCLPDSQAPCLTISNSAHTHVKHHSAQLSACVRVKRLPAHLLLQHRPQSAHPYYESSCVLAVAAQHPAPEQRAQRSLVAAASCGH